MTRSPSASRRSLERGQISWVTLALILAVLGGGYLAVVWAPVYIVHYEVKRVTREYMNKAIKEIDDRALVEAMCKRLGALDDLETVEADGTVTRTPTVEVRPQDVTWERDTTVRPAMLHVTFDYVRVVQYPWLKRVDERIMTVEFTQDLEVPNWGKAH